MVDSRRQRESTAPKTAFLVSRLYFGLHSTTPYFAKFLARHGLPPHVPEELAIAL